MTNWKPLKQFVVEYEDGDDVGKVLAWISMLPFVLLFGSIAVTYAKRDIKCTLFLVGQAISLAVNKVLKETIRQPRPDSEHTFKNTNFGMPSDHTQYLAFFSVYYTLLCIQLKRSNGLDTLELVIKNLECLALCGATIIVAFSRVYLRYYTLEQVLAGGTVGVLLAVVYFSVASTRFVQDLASKLKTSQMGKKLKIA